MNRTEKVLALILAGIFIVFVAGTGYGVVTGSRARKLSRDSVPATVAEAGVWDGLGRVRARTRGEPGAVVVVDIAFPYDSGDRQFREELARKRNDMRAAATAFFSSRSADDLRPANEPTVKAALRDTLNSMLSLGRIDELYFSELRVIE
ncbi:MAG: hypothetical protein CVV51_08035 [Spirochaetae bacterium HGW-Spirochaetae-7]|jgi:flagellar basal body-associated protein FliL|nr:MAG: hypothetical protein CVV51_08035 [Spirochaetae bacterium HGW-Spirochaetae-7]